MLMITSAVAYASVWFSFQPHATGWVADVAAWMSATRLRIRGPCDQQGLAGLRHRRRHRHLLQLHAA